MVQEFEKVLQANREKLFDETNPAATEYKFVRSRYLYGSTCTHEMMERLAKIITDAGGHVDTVFDTLRKTDQLDKNLAQVLTDYAATPIFPKLFEVDWGKKGQFAIMGVKAGHSITFRDIEGISCSGFTSEAEFWWEKSTIPIEKAEYQIFELRDRMPYSQWVNFAMYRGFESPSLAELANLYRYLPIEIKRPMESLKMSVPDSRNSDINLFGVKLATQNSQSYTVGYEKGIFCLAKNTLMLVRRYAV